MNIRQHRFVTEYLRFGDANVAYRNAYNSVSSSRTIESAANRLLRNPEIKEAINNAQARIRYEVEQELKEELKKELLSVQRKRELLRQIAEGELCMEQHYKGKDCHMCTMLVRPTVSQMLRAIDLDSKLAAHYPEKRANVITAYNTSPLERRNGVSTSPTTEDTTYPPHVDEVQAEEPQQGKLSSLVKEEYPKGEVVGLKKQDTTSIILQPDLQVSHADEPQQIKNNATNHNILQQTASPPGRGEGVGTSQKEIEDAAYLLHVQGTGGNKPALRHKKEVLLE